MVYLLILKLPRGVHIVSVFPNMKEKNDVNGNAKGVEGLHWYKMMWEQIYQPVNLDSNKREHFCY